MIRYKAIIAFISFCLAACGGSKDLGSLESIHSEIQQAFPAISHISAEALETRLAAGSPNILILDTRPVAEYNVSHIEGALQLDPDITAQAFKARFAEIAANKTIIIYCSVGWRSTIAADRLTEAVKAAGGSSIMNLEGGLFGWHNDGRPVVNAAGRTTLIHPYNNKWGALVSRAETLSYSPS